MPPPRLLGRDGRRRAGGGGRGKLCHKMRVEALELFELIVTEVLAAAAEVAELRVARHKHRVVDHAPQMVTATKKSGR